LYILDSDVLTIVGGGRVNANVTAWYEAIDETDIYLTVIAIKEQAKNATRLKRKGHDTAANRVEATLNKIKEIFAKKILVLDAPASEAWGRLLGDREAHLLDAAVAAIAKEGGFIVVTRNVKHYAGRGVAVIDPFRNPPRLHGVA
jgi:predicted nucleic acid-binding protein